MQREGAACARADESDRKREMQKSARDKSCIRRYSANIHTALARASSFGNGRERFFQHSFVRRLSCERVCVCCSDERERAGIRWREHMKEMNEYAGVRRAPRFKGLR
jgi:hypothetical protein